mgnify:CR=1 FL=1
MGKAQRYNMAIVGNCSYLAYIDVKASVKWLCWPRFDDSFVFGSLLDEERGGQFDVTPQAPFTSQQAYLNNTNVVVTTFQVNDDTFEVTDFAPRFGIHERYHKPTQFFRRIRPLKGTPRIRVSCRPRGHYGEVEAQALSGSNHISYTGLHTPLRLTTNLAKSYILTEKFFPLTEDVYLVMSCGEPFEAPLRDTFEEFLNRTTIYWRDWVKATYIPSIFQKELIRSALTLKIHQYEDTGAIIAAGTTSLPEAPGSGRNWDYRYCWIRDAYFSLAALNSLGHFTEGQRYANYILGLAEDYSELRPVYKIDGSSDMTEREIDLAGHHGEKPVRVGNQAHQQVQNDVYGQVLLSLVPLYIDARLDTENSPPIRLINDLLKAMELRLEDPDAGIWELRGIRHIHLATVLFHWAGAGAAIKIAQHKGEKEIGKRAQLLRQRAADLIEKCWRPHLGIYASHVDGDDLDAAGFLLLTMGYLAPSDPKAKSHLHGLAKGLMSPSGFIYRYRAHDDFGETHSSFLICQFWYAESLAVIGETAEAEKELHKILSTANHVGLMSEDVDATGQEQWGNFPQTYSHVGLINAACRLARRLDRAVFN